MNLENHKKEWDEFMEDKKPKGIHLFASNEDFVKEYKKAKKLKFANKLEERKFKDEWIDLFENDKEKVLELQDQINKINTEIDSMVYKLYDLTKEEISIVENKK